MEILKCLEVVQISNCSARMSGYLDINMILSVWQRNQASSQKL